MALIVVRLVAAAALLGVAFVWREPSLASWRVPLFAALIALPLVLIAAEAGTLWRVRAPGLRAVSAASLLLATAALLTTGAHELAFRYQRSTVLSADPQLLEKLGRHLLVGYRDRDALHTLIRHRAIAGVFLTARNVEGKSVETIRQEIAALQEIRRAQGLPPLWIATDQEGGGVSRLSPPLTRMPTLAHVAALHSDPAQRKVAVRQYASRQGRELAGLGVNLNFAPVVDLNHGVANPEDRYTRIASRAISEDPAVVADVAEVYCATLLMTGVHCTLKHFPGLGRVYDDTHKASADLKAPLADLADSDWLPFRKLMSDTAFTMLSHARLADLDRERPASFSPAVVTGLLREDWKHDGILITDDFSMGAVTQSREGIAGGAVAALNAGVDLILLSFDPDQYFTVMFALLRADRAGRLNAAMLARSDARLARAVGY